MFSVCQPTQLKEVQLWTSQNSTSECHVVTELNVTKAQSEEHYTNSTVSILCAAMIKFL